MRTFLKIIISTSFEPYTKLSKHENNRNVKQEEKNSFQKGTFIDIDYQITNRSIRVQEFLTFKIFRMATNLFFQKEMMREKSETRSLISTKKEDKANIKSETKYLQKSNHIYTVSIFS